MATDASNELSRFHQFVGQKLRDESQKLTPEQVLSEWRERQETIESVGRGLADVDAGRTRPASDVIEQLKCDL